MIQRNCYLCGSSKQTRLQLNEDLGLTGTYVICDNCTLVFHSPTKSQDEFAAFYRNQYSTDYHESMQMQDDFATQRVNFLSKYFSPAQKGNILEIGCSIGSFLNVVYKQGYSITGVEPSQDFVARAKSMYNLDIHNGVYEDLPFHKGKYQLICLFHALEHVVNPVEYLERMRMELRDDGVLYIVVPTFAEHQLSIVFKSIHPTVFTEATLERLLLSTGFKLTVIKTSGSNISVIASKNIAKEFVLPPVQETKEKTLEAINTHLTRRQNCIDKIQQILLALSDGSEVAIFGSGHTLLDLDAIYSLRKLNITHVYDSDPEKCGRKILHFTVSAGKYVNEFAGRYIVIASYAYQEELANNLSFLEKRGVKIVTLYDKSGRE